MHTQHTLYELYGLGQKLLPDIQHGSTGIRIAGFGKIGTVVQRYINN